MDKQDANGTATRLGKSEGSTTGMGGGSTFDMLRSIGSAALLNAMSAARSTPVGPQMDSVRDQATSIWSSARPWSEFLNTKKIVPASNASEIQQRLLDNLQYFSSNYILIFVALSAMGVLVHPMSFVCVLVLLGLYVYMFLQHPASVTIGPVVLPPQPKRIAFGIASVLCLYITDAVTILGSWALFSIIISIVHAGARVSVQEPDFETAVEV